MGLSALLSNISGFCGGILCDIIFSVTAITGCVASMNRAQEIAPWFWRSGSSLVTIYSIAMFAPLLRLVVTIRLAHQFHRSGASLPVALVLSARSTSLLAWEAASKTAEVFKEVPRGNGCGARCTRKRLHMVRQGLQAWAADSAARMELLRPLPEFSEVETEASGCFATRPFEQRCFEREATYSPGCMYLSVALCLLNPSSFSMGASWPNGFLILLKLRFYTSLVGITFYIAESILGVHPWWDPMSVVQMLSALNMLGSMLEVRLLGSVWPRETFGIILHSRFAGDRIWEQWSRAIVRDFAWFESPDEWALLSAPSSHNLEIATHVPMV
jgi:hypothetical protein